MLDEIKRLQKLEEPTDLDLTRLTTIQSAYLALPCKTLETGQLRLSVLHDFLEIGELEELPDWQRSLIEWSLLDLAKFIAV